MTPQEREALIKVRNDLNTGAYLPVLAMDDEETQLGFDMNAATSTCGAVRCIGGWMMAHMSPRATPGMINSYVDNAKPPLCNLFYPSEVNCDWESITPRHAVDAIDNFLKTGDPKWVEVVES